MEYQKEKDINRQEITQYMYVLNERFQPKTVKRKMATLHAFFEYLEFIGTIEKNPMDKIKYKMKQEKKLPRVIDRSQLNALYQVLYHAENKNSLRDCAVIELLLSTGIRVSELCCLKTKDVNLSEHYIRVYGKGSKERIIYLGNEQVIKILKEYHKKRGEDSIFFFTNRNQNHISDQSVRNIINEYTKKAGIQDKITPHMFRHTFATMLLEENVDIRYIQNILGHSSISTTEIYTHISSMKQKDIMINNNPRNHILLQK